MGTTPDHLRPITIEIPVTWTAEQALAGMRQSRITQRAENPSANGKKETAEVPAFINRQRRADNSCYPHRLSLCSGASKTADEGFQCARRCIFA